MKPNRNGPQEFSPEGISQVIARYRASGLSLARFAREEGLPAGRLHYWIYEKSRRSAGPTGKAPAAAPVFREVKLGPILPATANWGAEVSLPGGVAARFSAGSAPAWIGSVVQALQRPC